MPATRHPPGPTAPSWDLDGPYGREVWSGPSDASMGAFTGVLLDGAPVSLDPRDGELHLLRPRASNCAHPGPWPFAFAFCPACGTPLQPPPPPRPAEAWSSPANAASGQPAAASTGTPDPARRAELPLPGPSRLDFVVAGTPPRLLAFDGTSGRLHGWADGPDDPFEAGRWRELATLPAAINLPRWSWAAAAFPSGVALPGDGGPLWLPLSTRLAPPLPPPVMPHPALAMQRCVGGAAGLGGLALVPVLADGGLAVAAWLPREGRWERVAPAGAGTAPAEQVFAAPSTTATEALWVGEHGQLHARVGPDGAGVGVTCEYRPWGGGWQPMRGVRPVLASDGVFHQLGRVDGQQAFEALLPPGATPQRRGFDRYVASCGSATFLRTARHREPWAAPQKTYRGEDDSFLLPLLAFAGGGVLVASCSPRNRLRQFLETEGERDADVECRIAFAGASVVPADLRATVRAGSAWDLVPVIYRRTLLLYDVRGNRCLRWPLVPDGPGGGQGGA